MLVANFILVGVTLALWLGMGWHVLVSWLIAANFMAFGIFGMDKFSARKGWRRVSEADLLYCALIGGSPGAWLGMRTFRHKTRKTEFRRSYWGIVGTQIFGLFAYLWFR